MVLEKAEYIRRWIHLLDRRLQNWRTFQWNFNCPLITIIKTELHVIYLSSGSLNPFAVSSHYSLHICANSNQLSDRSTVYLLMNIHNLHSRLSFWKRHILQTLLSNIGLRFPFDAHPTLYRLVQRKHSTIYH